MAAASRAAYAAAAAAYSTVLASLGLEPASLEPAAGKKAAAAFDLNSSSLFNSQFRIGAGAAGGSAVPVYDAHFQGSMPYLPAFGSAVDAKGGLKPSMLQHGMAAAAAAVEQVKPAVWLCTLVQIVGMLLISGTMHALTVLPMLGWM
jgi:hypothetical protein